MTAKFQACLRLGACLLYIGLPVGAASADEDGRLPQLIAAPQALPLDFGFVGLAGRPLDSASLGAHRGGSELIQLHADSALDGIVGGNEASNVRTGGNLITAGSFAGASGLATVVQNSGNNVLIQNSTIVNVQVQ